MQDRSIKRISLFIASLTAFLAPFDGSSVIIALPSIGKEFLMDAIALGWLSTAYLIVIVYLAMNKQKIE